MVWHGERQRAQIRSPDYRQKIPSTDYDDRLERAKNGGPSQTGPGEPKNKAGVRLTGGWKTFVKPFGACTLAPKRII